MRKIDFLSNPPKTFIFQKSSNKTAFGGVLTIIYLLIILIIAFTYIYNFVVNDKYIISYINSYEPKTDKEISELRKDPNLNPTLNFVFKLFDMFGDPLSNNYLLMNMSTNSLLDRNTIYKCRVSDLKISVIYNCSDMNCSLRQEDQKYENQFFFTFVLWRQSYIINLQDKEQPIILGDNNYLISQSVMNQDVARTVTNYWRIINITEEKGLLDNFIEKKKKFIGGDIYQSESGNIKSVIVNTDITPGYNFHGIYKPIFHIGIDNDFDNYVEYKRKRVSEFSLIANICSLALTIFNGFRFGFNFFYSEKFANYEVIDKILSSKRKSKQKKIVETKFDKSFPLLSINEMKDVEIEEKEEEKNENKTDRLIEIEENEDSLPKYNIFSFIANFFYCNRCKKNKVQANITICNNILEKYYSIENLLYNQFMLENLLQDYKWNNPDLNSIKNIELIYKLKQMIKTDGILQ